MARSWLPKTLTLTVWTVAALSATYWVLQFAGANATRAIAPSVAPAALETASADLTRVFGPPVATAPVAAVVTPAPVDPSTRFALLGVVAGRAKAGVALISVEGKTARPYRVGSTIEDSYLLKSVATRSATLAPVSGTDATFTLELTRTATPAATGLPSIPSITPVLPVAPPVPSAAAPTASPAASATGSLEPNVRPRPSRPTRPSAPSM